MYLFPTEAFLRDHRSDLCPGLSPIHSLQEDEGTVTLITNGPPKRTRYKVKLGDVLEVRAGSELRPVLSTVAGDEEGGSVSQPPVLSIEKMRRTQVGKNRHGIAPGRSSIVCHVDHCGDATAGGEVSKIDGKDAIGS